MINIYFSSNKEVLLQLSKCMIYVKQSFEDSVQIRIRKGTFLTAKQ